ncbi:MAG: AAA family ATPase [Euryarchaeota archaeon]|nr:AAA family ATPase [Euryarchaeota archaeon]
MSIQTDPSTYSVRSERATGAKGPVRPSPETTRPSTDLGWDELLLLHMGEGMVRGALLTQRQLTTQLRTSQPTVSRALARLSRGGWVRVHPVSALGAAFEQGYSLTPTGTDRLSSLVSEVRALRWPGSSVSLGELETTFQGVPLTKLLNDSRSGGSPEDLLALHRPEDDLVARQELGPRAARGAASTTPIPTSGPLPLVGRINERYRLARALGRLRAVPARGEVLVLLGPAGVGKSRLLQFLEEAAVGAGVHALHGQALAGPSLPFSPFEEMLGATEHREGTPPRGRGAPPAPERPDLVAPTGPRGGLSRIRRMLGYLERLERMAREGPVLLVVDDLERASPSALQVFHFLATNIPRLDAPVLLVAASRDENWFAPGVETPRSRQLVQVLDVLRRSVSERSGVVPLGPLTLQECRVLAGASLGEGVGQGADARRLREVIRRAQGNPLFLLEGIRDLQTDPADPAAPRSRRVGEGGRPRSAGPLEGTLPVPPVVRRLVLARMEGLPPTQTRLLEMASCLGEIFEIAPLESLATMDPSMRGVQVRDLLEELSRRRHLLRPDGPRRYAFSHLVILEVLEGQGLERRQWAARLAEWWERERPGDATTIARLFSSARDPARALPWIESAVRDLLRRQEYETIEELVRSAHDLLSTRPQARAERSAHDVALANRLWTLGATSTALGILDLVLSIPLPRTLRWEAEASLSNVMAATDPGSARRRLEDLRREIQESDARPTPLLEGQVRAVAAFLYGQAGAWEDCLQESEDALERLAQANDWIWTTWAIVSRSIALLCLGRASEALAECESARSRYRGELFLPFLAFLDNIEGRVRQVLGDAPGALRRFDEGQRLARRIGNVTTLSSLLANRAAAELTLHDHGAARRTIQELQGLAQKFDLSVHAVWAKYRWGQWLWGQGRKGESERVFAEVQEVFGGLGLEGALLLPQVYRAVHEVEEGDRRKGSAWLQELRPHLVRVDLDERVLLPTSPGFDASSRGPLRPGPGPGVPSVPRPVPTTGVGKALPALRSARAP